MLVLYLITLIVGGVLLLLSIVAGGGDHAGDHVGDVGGHGGHGDGDSHAHGHGHGPGEAAHVGVAEALHSWLPFGSLRFWTFFAAFFGLTGTAMTTLGLAGPIAIAALAGAVGYVSGLLLVRTIRQLHQHPSDSSLAAADLVGATAQVLVSIASGRTGKVRLHLKGRAVDLLAETEEPAELAAGERALVIAAPRAGHVVVARVANLS